MSYVDNILIVQTAFIGDVILVTPLIRETKKLFPAASLDVMVIPQTASILANNPHINEILVFDKRKDKLKAFLKSLKTIRQRSYDLVLVPHSSYTTALLVALAGIPIRVGFSGKLKSYLMTRRIPPSKNIHRIERNLKLLEPFGLSEGDLQSELFPSTVDTAVAVNIGLGKDRPVIAVAPGSVWQTKCWPKEYYIDLIRKVKDKADFIFIGAKAEEELCSDILSESGCTGINYAGKTTILQSAALIGRCELILCNDSGAMHIANAMRTRVFAFFGPTVQRFGFYPYREDDLVFEVDLDCRPCNHHGPLRCPLSHHHCMRLIKTDDVLVRIEELIISSKKD